MKTHAAIVCTLLTCGLPMLSWAQDGVLGAPRGPIHGTWDKTAAPVLYLFREDDQRDTANNQRRG